MSINQVKQLRDFEGYFELVDYFNSEEKCVQYLATLRWNGVPECPYCAHDVCYILTGKFKRFKCAACRKQFSVRVGTIFEDSKIPLRKWFFACFLFTAHKKGISSHQLGKDLKVTQKTAWFMLQRIRESFVFDEPEELKVKIEVDETFMGGKENNKHENKKAVSKYGKRVKTQIPVIGVMEIQGRVYAVPVAETRVRNLYPVITGKVPPPVCL